MKKISVMVPCYNEEGNVRGMCEALLEIMSGLPYDFEIIFTDNCSTDGTKPILRELAGKDQRVKVLFNNRNYGTDGRSGRNSLRYASGDVIIHIACDFQEPPELIPKFVKEWEQGYKVVCGQKISSKEGRLKYGCRDFFYRIIRSMSDTPQYSHISGILLYDRDVLENYLQSDYDFYFRYALADMGYEVKLIQYEQQARRSGKSSFNTWRYLTFAINSVTSTSTIPLRLMTVTGFILSVTSFLIGLVYLIMKLIFWNWFQTGMAPILIGLFFFGSAQLLFVGVLGEYLSAVLRKVTRKPDVILSEKLNL